MASSLGVGQYAATEIHYAFDPRRAPLRRRAYYSHGVFSNATSVINEPALSAVVDTAQVPVAACDFKGSQSLASWGDDTSRDKIPTARDFIEARFGGATDKIIGWGTSMGSEPLLNRALAHPDEFAAICLEVPAVDPQDIYDNNRGGFTASISAAHGGRPTNGRTPARNAAAFAALDIPVLILYSTDDPICIPSITEDYAEAIGAELVSLGAIGHAISTVDPLRVAEFMWEHSNTEDEGEHLWLDSDLYLSDDLYLIA